MAAKKVVVTIDSALLSQVDQLVAEGVFPNRNKAIQEALRENLTRLKRTRLVAELTRLDPREEQAMADKGLAHDASAWPKY